MALELKTGLFYELLIRGSYGGEHQLDAEGKPIPAGQFSGAQYIEGNAVVDSGTGQVVQYTPGPPQELEKEKVVDYLGTRFADFEASYRLLEKSRGELETKLNDAIETIATLRGEKAQVERERDQLRAEKG